MGFVASLGYSGRNYLKDEPTRKFVSLAQLVNATNDISTRNIGVVSEVAGKTIEKVDNISQSVFKAVGEKVPQANPLQGSKLSGIASKVVNPLLCVASGFRIAKDEDKSSALIEEGLAMGTMFGAEKAVKNIKTPIEELVRVGYNNIDDVALDLAKSKKFCTLLNNKTAKNALVSCAKKISKMSKGKKTMLFVGAELALMGASIFSFDMGKNLGYAITERDPNKHSKEETLNYNIENFLRQRGLANTESGT